VDWRATCSIPARAAVVTERMDPNMRAFSGSRNGWAGDEGSEFFGGGDGESAPEFGEGVVGRGSVTRGGRLARSRRAGALGECPGAAGGRAGALGRR